MKKEIISENLIYFVLLAAIILEFFDCFYIGSNMGNDMGITEASNKMIMLSGYEDKTVHIPTEDEILAGKSTKQIFDYYVEEQDYIMHAGGSINGYSYTNSYEALKENYNNGNRIFEIDLNYTSDKQLVLVHGWEKKDYDYKFGLPYNKTTAVMNYNTFKKTLIRNKYHTMDINDLIKFMRENPYSYFILNIKNGSKLNITKDALNKLVNAANKDSKILNRLVIWGYNNSVISAAKKIYNFELITYSVNDPIKSDKQRNKIINYCKKNKISSIVYSTSNFDIRLANMAKNNGIYNFVYTSDNNLIASELLRNGATMVMSNKLINKKDIS